MRQCELTGAQFSWLRGCTTYDLEHGEFALFPPQIAIWGDRTLSNRDHGLHRIQTRTQGVLAAVNLSRLQLMMILRAAPTGHR